MKFELRDYQKSDLAFHIANPKSLNLSAPGTGKTPTVCVLSYYWWARKQKRTIWAMPKSLLRKNKDELPLFTGFEPEDIVILDSDYAPLTNDWTGPTKKRLKKVRGKAYTAPDGSTKYRREMVEEEVKDLVSAARQADAKVLLFTFAFLRSHWEKLFENFDDIGLFLVDELHMGYSSAGSQQSKSFFRTMRKVPAFCGMTGTLIDGRLDSAFPAIHAIEPRYYGSHQGFIQQHAGYVDDYGKVQWWRGHDKLKSILERHAVRHTFREVYGDEPVHFETRWLEMDLQQREPYKEFHERAMLELADGRVLDGSLPGVATIRCTQIMGHPETLGLVPKNFDTPKDRALLEYAAEGLPMVVFAANQPEQERIVKLLNNNGRVAALINASVTGARRSQVDEDFRKGKLDTIVASAATAGVGFNWSRCRRLIFASCDYKDANFGQALMRGLRGNREHVLLVTTLAYKDSIDERKLQILTEKSKDANRVDPEVRVLEF